MEFRAGGFQVVHKLINESGNRALSFDDLTHFRNVLQAIVRSFELAAEIDHAMPAWPLD